MSGLPFGFGPLPGNVNGPDVNGPDVNGQMWTGIEQGYGAEKTF